MRSLTECETHGCTAAGVYDSDMGMRLCNRHNRRTEASAVVDATWNAALEAAAKVLLDSGLQGNTASKHEVASRILSLRRPTP